MAFAQAYPYIGSFTPASQIYIMFNTVDSAGAPKTLAGSPGVLVYKNGSTAESATTGITLTADFDARTGLNNVTIDTSLNSSFFADGSECFAVITTGSVSGVSEIGRVVAAFTIAATANIAANILQVASANVTTSVAHFGVNIVNIASVAVATNTAHLGVNVVNYSGTAVGAPDTAGYPKVTIKDGSGQGEINLTSGTVDLVTDITTKTGYRLSATGVDDILRTALTEAYAADGAAGTLSQILFGLQAFLQEKSVSGTTLTTKRLDGSTTAMTFTLNDSANPTSITRAT